MISQLVSEDQKQARVKLAMQLKMYPLYDGENFATAVTSDET